MSRAADVATLLGGYTYNYVGEVQLQDGLELAMQASSLDYQREVELPGGRIDFLLDGLGMEVKVDSSPLRVLEQLQRYARSVEELLLVTTRVSHRTLPHQIAGTPLRVLVLGGRL